MTISTRRRVHVADSSSLKLSVEDQVALEVGRAILRFNALEWYVGSLLVGFFGDLPDTEIAATLSVMSFRRRRELLLALTRARASEEKAIATLQVLLQRANTIESRRNALVHSTYFYNELPAKLVRTKHRIARKGRLHRDHELLPSAAAISQLRDDIETTAFELSEWFLMYGMALTG